jgi:hypothetical protein
MTTGAYSVCTQILVEDPRQCLEGRSRQHDFHKSKILLRAGATLAENKTKQNTKKNQNSNTLNPQPKQSLSMPHYTEKRGLLCH